MSDSVAAVPMTPEAFTSRYDTSIVVRRWGATWIDLIVVGILAAAPFALPDNLQGPVFVVAALVALAYFPLLERIYGRTLGKVVCRLRIVNETGGLPSWGQAIIRTILRLIEVNPALMGGLPAGIAVLASKKRQRLGDMAANTFVLREEDYRYLGQLHTIGAQASPELAAPILPKLPPLPPSSSSADQWLVPVNRSGWCIAAGYLGLCAIIVLPAPAALVVGIIGLRDLRRHPELKGKGRAWFGIVMGGLFTLLLVATIISSIVGSK